MDVTFLSIVLFVLYLLGSRLVMRCLMGALRDAAFAFLNVAAVAYVIYDPHESKSVLKLALYAGLVVIQFGLLRLFAEARDWRLALAFFTPIAALIVVRDLPPAWYQAMAHALGKQLIDLPTLMGISYFAFRCSRLVLEVRNGSVPRPNFWQYLGFAFFLPTLAVGPINTYASHRRGFADAPYAIPICRAALRCLVGLVKYQILSGILGRLSYRYFLLDGHAHPWIDLPVVMVVYYLYLYCNFSGFCDLAIGAAALIGIPVMENFDNPFAARNIKDFWNRWHITLSQWMRDIVFAPLSKYLVRLMGPSQANQAIAITITVVFLLVGLWHGLAWNFAIFGGIHAVGLVTNHYYTIGLKKMLGREGFKAYMGSLWIRGAAVVLTFAYCAASLLFFANNLPQIKEIFGALR